MESEQIKSDTNMLSSSIYDILQQNLFFDEIVCSFILFTKDRQIYLILPMKLL